MKKIKKEKRSAKEYKKNYLFIKKIFFNLVLFTFRKSFICFFTQESIRKWSWYINEVSIILNSLENKEKQLLFDHFFLGKTMKDMFLSKSKYYESMYRACKNFVTRIDKTFIEMQKIHFSKNKDEL